MQGFPAVNNVVVPGSTPADIQISTTPLPANATTIVNEKVNLDASHAVISATFDPNDPATYSYRTIITL